MHLISKFVYTAGSTLTAKTKALRTNRSTDGQTHPLMERWFTAKEKYGNVMISKFDLLFLSLLIEGTVSLTDVQYLS